MPRELRYEGVQAGEEQGALEGHGDLVLPVPQVAGGEVLCFLQVRAMLEPSFEDPLVREVREGYARWEPPICQRIWSFRFTQTLADGAQASSPPRLRHHHGAFS